VPRSASFARSAGVRSATEPTICAAVPRELTANWASNLRSGPAPAGTLPRYEDDLTQVLGPGSRADGPTRRTNDPGRRNRGKMRAMDEPAELRYNGHWRMAVWALRVGYVGLTVGIAGLIAMSLGSTSWVLAVGVIIWLAAAAVTLAGVFRSRHELHEPRPGYWSMRFMLIHDTVHARTSAQRS
jgi:hypothetical protein